MKRPKAILTALGVLAVIGGILAFRADKRNSGGLQCTTATQVTNNCSLVTYITTSNDGTMLRCKAIGASSDQTCVFIRVTFNL